MRLLPEDFGMNFNGHLPPGSKTASMLVSLTAALTREGGRHAVMCPSKSVPHLKEQLLARTRGLLAVAAEAGRRVEFMSGAVVEFVCADDPEEAKPPADFRALYANCLAIEDAETRSLHLQRFVHDHFPEAYTALTGKKASEL